MEKMKKEKFYVWGRWRNRLMWVKKHTAAMEDNLAKSVKIADAFHHKLSL